MVSKICFGMSSTNIHLLQLKSQSHLQKRGLEMQVHQISFRRKNVKIFNNCIRQFAFPHQKA